MMFYVCHTCAVYKVIGDYSGTYWNGSRAEEIAENLRDYEIFIKDGTELVMDYCSGCGERGGDMYRARYYDELD